MNNLGENLTQEEIQVTTATGDCEQHCAWAKFNLFSLLKRIQEDFLFPKHYDFSPYAILDRGTCRLSSALEHLVKNKICKFCQCTSLLMNHKLPFQNFLFSRS